ncbi:MAG: glycosyltransferase family 2 protein [Rhodoferax sp.]|nr:glycosyltransferase family 2 protein [Rhodoferax sp.]
MPSSPPVVKSASVLAVIVSYQPDHARLLALLESVAGQVNRVVVVDNGSSCETVQYLRTLRARIDFDLIEFEQNRGIAAAHNAGVQLARDRKHDYVLLLDHDSCLAPGCVAALLRAHQSLSSTGVRLAAVGPQYRDETSGMPAPFLRYTRWGSVKVYPRNALETVEASVLISSGSLIAVTALDAIGPMDEGLFIDGVDWDWCFRASSLGYRLYGIGAACMTHSLGDSGLRLWRWVIPLHSPLRHYYAYRNAILLCRRATVPWSWKLHFSSRLLIRFAIYMVLAPHRLQRCRFILRGVAHGLANRAGPI